MDAGQIAGARRLTLDEFDFELDEHQIALRPARPRSAARLLVCDESGRLTDSQVIQLPDFLRPGDLLVFNNTRVINARLEGRRFRGDLSARIGIQLLAPLTEDCWSAFLRPGKRVVPGDIVSLPAGLTAEIISKSGTGIVRLRFNQAGSSLDDAIARAGDAPLPPYIASRRAPDQRDLTDYQPVFARHAGAVASPTASLHFDDDLLGALHRRRIRHCFLTLHVGAGTFLPVKTGDIDAHEMHSESGEVTAASADLINSVRRGGGRIVAVGTTVLRLLETASGREGAISPFSGSTDIFLRPGHHFAGADLLLTNFHLPRSTLLMLVAAFIGLDRQRALYAHALSQGFRFFSYGDASLLTLNPEFRARASPVLK